MIRLRSDYLMIFLSFVLCVFHMFTYFQIYYSFFVTLAIFFLILAFYCINTKGLIFLSRGNGLGTLCAAVLLIIFIGIFVKGYDTISLVGAYFPFVMWAVIYYTVMPLMSNKAKRWFIFCYLCFFIVSVVATLIVVFNDNNAARLLAGAATDEERDIYYQQGVGGYGFVYGSVFLVYGMILFSTKQTSKMYKLLLWATAILTTVMIVYASYTTALLMIILAFCLSFYTKSKSRYAPYVFLIAVVAMVFFLNPLLELIYGMAMDMELEWITNRIGQLLNAEASGTIEGLKRVQLYKLSMESFMKNPLFGGQRIGRHSMLFDTMGLYGIFGLFLYAAIIKWLGILRRQSAGREGLVFWGVALLYVINTNDTIVFMPMVMFVLPMILSLTTRGATYEKDTAD